MDFRIDPRRRAIESEARAFFAQHLTPAIIGAAWESGTLHDADLHRAAAREGWIGSAWSSEVGGRGLTYAASSAFWETAHYCGAPVDGHQLTELVGAVLLDVGNDWQRDQVVPSILAGETVIALGFTEADAGSDVAAATTRATRVDGGYLITGAKMFTTLAHVSDYAFLLARTDPDQPKHRGLTMFLVPLRADGVDIQPIRTFGGERTNATFYQDVFVPEESVVGEPGRGWSVLLHALDHERATVSSWLGQLRRLFDDLVVLLEQRDAVAEARPLLAEFRGRIEAGAVLADRVACCLDSRAPATVEAAMTKLWITDAMKELARRAMDLVGPDALLLGAESPAGQLQHVWRHVQVSTIYGGSNEIQRNIIAQRALGLPA